MAFLPEPTIIPPGTPDPEFWLNSQLCDLYAAASNLNLTSRDGTIQHGDKAGNLAAKYLVFTSNGVANTEDAVLHNLGYVPVGYLVVRQDKAAILYSGTTASTLTTIFLKSSAASVAWTVLVF